jgi:hypothetical protein
MSSGTRATHFGPTTSVVDAFLEQLRRAPSYPPHVTLPSSHGRTTRDGTSLTAFAVPEHRQAAVAAAQEAVAAILKGLDWPADTSAVQQYVEEMAPRVAAVLVLRGYLGPEELAGEYERVYVAGWQGVFGAL